MTKKSSTTHTRCHTSRKIPKNHRSTRAHIKWLARPRLGIITQKFFDAQLECVCEGESLLKRILPPSKRLLQLAEPVGRNITKKYAEKERAKLKCSCAPKNPKPVSTRLDQLAMPYVR